MCGAVENRWTGYRQQSQEKKEDQNVNRRIFKTIARKKTCADCRTRGGPGCERVAGPGRVRGSASAASARPAQADQPPGRVHRAGAAQRHPAREPSDPAKRHRGQPQQGVRPAAAVPRDRLRRHPHAEKVWYILEDASTSGAADDLGVNFAPKLANIGISCPACVQTVHLINLSPEQNHFPGQAYRDGPHRQRPAKAC